MVKDKNYADIDISKMSNEDLAKIKLRPSGYRYIWKKYILGFIIENNYKDFTLSDISKYILERYNLKI